MKMSYYEHCKTNIDMSFYYIDIIKNSIYNAYNDKKIYNKLEHIEYLFHNLYKICNELEVHTRALRDKLYESEYEYLNNTYDPYTIKLMPGFDIDDIDLYDKLENE